MSHSYVTHAWRSVTFSSVILNLDMVSYDKAWQFNFHTVINRWRDFAAPGRRPVLENSLRYDIEAKDVHVNVFFRDTEH